MPKIEDSIDVQVPVREVYDQWTQFEEFPRFMDGIQSVQQLDDTHVQWARRFAVNGASGRPRSPSSSRTKGFPGERSRRGQKRRRRQLREDRRSRDTYQCRDGRRRRLHDGERRGDLLGVVKAQVHGDLERFKRLIENRGEPTGAYRGRCGTARLLGSERLRQIALLNTSSRTEGVKMTNTAERTGQEGLVGQPRRRCRRLRRRAGEGRRVEGAGQEQARRDPRSAYERGGVQARKIAQALRRSGEQLSNEGNGQQVAGLVEGAADQLERLGGYLERTSGVELVRDIEDFARRRPGLSRGRGWWPGLRFVAVPEGYFRASLRRISAGRRRLEPVRVRRLAHPSGRSADEPFAREATGESVSDVSARNEGTELREQPLGEVARNLTQDLSLLVRQGSRARESRDGTEGTCGGSGLGMIGRTGS